jgi:hypothetical protein
MAHAPHGFTVRPAVWKRALGQGKDKEACQLRAMQLFPSANLRLKKHHGRAEAFLLALYGQRHLGAVGHVPGVLARKKQAAAVRWPTGGLHDCLAADTLARLGGGSRWRGEKSAFEIPIRLARLRRGGR